MSIFVFYVMFHCERPNLSSRLRKRENDSVFQNSESEE